MPDDTPVDPGYGGLIGEINHHWEACEFCQNGPRTEEGTCALTYDPCEAVHDDNIYCDGYVALAPPVEPTPAGTPLFNAMLPPEKTDG